MRTGFMLWGLLLWEQDEGPFAWPHSIGTGNLLDEETAGEGGRGSVCGLGSCVSAGEGQGQFCVATACIAQEPATCVMRRLDG